MKRLIEWATGLVEHELAAITLVLGFVVGFAVGLTICYVVAVMSQ